MTPRFSALRPIGFDIREHQSALDPHWTKQRVETYLVKADVRRPLSADPSVWRTAFPEACNSEWRGVLDHWSDMKAMRQAARSLGVAGSTVAVALVWETLDSRQQVDWASQWLEQTSPAELGDEWALLGYDVADRWLTSGLSNCGYSAAEHLGWVRLWRDKINENHLFPEATDALAFAEATSVRVPEHAPFFVWALLACRSAPQPTLPGT